MDQDPKPGERSNMSDLEPPGRREAWMQVLGMISSIMSDLVPAGLPARRRVLWTIRIVLGLVVVLSVLTLVGSPFDVTLWDWLDLLIIPIVLAIGGFLFTRAENRATQAAAERRAQDDTL